MLQKVSKVVVDQNKVCLNLVFVESLSVTETFEMTFETLKIMIWMRLLKPSNVLITTLTY